MNKKNLKRLRMVTIICLVVLVIELMYILFCAFFREVKSIYFDFVYKGNGDFVISQYPQPNEKIAQGSTIMIQLGGKKDES